MRTSITSIICLTVLLSLFPQSLFAQVRSAGSDNQSQWGFSFTSSVTEWEVTPSLGRKFLIPGELEIHGSEFRVGVLKRSKRLGGDWGVEYVRRVLGDSQIDRLAQHCLYSNEGNIQCLPKGFVASLNNATMHGVEVHRFFSFITIKRSVKLGVNLGAGFAKISGTSEKHIYDTEFIPGQFWLRQIERIETISAKDVFGDFLSSGYVPLGRVEAVVAVPVGNNFEIKLAGGLSIPGVNKFNMGVNFLF